MKGALSRISEIYERRLEEPRRREGDFIGYICCYVPVEVITASGAHPVRILGNMREPPREVDAHLETIMCPYVRSFFDLALRGEYDFLRGLIVPHTCDNVQRIYDIWRERGKPEFIHFLDVPHMLHDGSFRFFRRQVELLIKYLGNFLGKDIKGGLEDAIKLHNRIRGLLRRVYEERKKKNPPITGVEVLKLLVAGMLIPPEEYASLLEELLEEIKGREAYERVGPRIMIYGAHLDDIAFIELIEKSGGMVVMDDLCTGTRLFWKDVVGDDPAEALSRSYLYNIPCPRTYREGKASERFKYLSEYAKEFNVDGVILYITRFCDTHELEVPDIRDLMKGEGYEVLPLEVDYSIGEVERLRTRVQAFLEILI